MSKGLNWLGENVVCGWVLGVLESTPGLKGEQLGLNVEPVLGEHSVVEGDDGSKWLDW